MINKEVLHFIANQKIGVDKRIDIAKGLYKVPSSLSEWGRFIKFTIKYRK